MKKKIIYFDMDGVLADYEGKANYKDNPEKETNGFFTELEPIKGAVEAFKKLSEHYDCYILTTAPWSSPIAMAEKRLWVEKHLGDYGYKKITETHHKELSIGDYLIDDRTVNGAGEFTGEHIHFGSEDFPDWNSVVEYLMNPIDLAIGMIVMGKIGIEINLVLLALNLIPIPPLDGSRVVASFLPFALAKFYARIEPFGFVILLLLLNFRVLGIVVDPIVGTLQNWIGGMFRLGMI